MAVTGSAHCRYAHLPAYRHTCTLGLNRARSCTQPETFELLTDAAVDDDHRLRRPLVARPDEDEVAGGRGGRSSIISILSFLHWWAVGAHRSAQP